MGRTGWVNCAALALLTTVLLGQTVFLGGMWWLRAIAVGGMTIVTVRCTVNAANKKEK